MLRTPTEGALSGEFYHIQFKSPKSISEYYRRWHFYSQDAQPFPITAEQSDCWQKFGSYGFFNLKEAKKRLKEVQKLGRKEDHEKKHYIYRLARVQFVIYTSGA